MNICKNCWKVNNRKRSEFCSRNCCDNWRYHNVPAEKEKIIDRNKKYNKEKYKSDENFRKKQIKHSRNWQKNNPERVKELSRKRYITYSHALKGGVFIPNFTFNRS
jgi:hypothetical protein